MNKTDTSLTQHYNTLGSIGLINDSINHITFRDSSNLINSLPMEMKLNEKSEYLKTQMNNFTTTIS